MWRRYKLPLRHFLTLVICFSIFVVCSGIMACSGEAPALLSLSYRLETVYEKGVWQERMRLFLLVDEKDGPGDIAEIHLACDQEELLWKMEKEAVVTLRSEGEVWMGHPGLSMPGGKPFPGAYYRVILIDAAGKSAERGLSLSSRNPAGGEDSTKLPILPEPGTLPGASGRRYIHFPERDVFTDYRWVRYNPEGTVLEEIEAFPDQSGRIYLPMAEDGTADDGFWYQLFFRLEEGDRYFRVNMDTTLR